MIERDFLMRLVNEATRAVARALFAWRNGQADEARAALADAYAALGADGPALLTADRDALLERARRGPSLSPDLLLAHADALGAHAALAPTPHEARAAAVRALWCLDAAVALPGAALPLDLPARRAALLTHAGGQPPAGAQTDP